MKKFISKNGVTSQSQSLSGGNPNSEQASRPVVGRRSFLKGLGATGALLVPASALLINQRKRRKTRIRTMTMAENCRKAMPQFFDFCARPKSSRAICGNNTGNSEATRTADFASPNPATGTFPTPTGGNPHYTSALTILDGDMPQYIHDNTDDEFSHSNFLLSYLKSKGANTADLDRLVGIISAPCRVVRLQGLQKRDDSPISPNSPWTPAFGVGTAATRTTPICRGFTFRPSGHRFECWATSRNSQN